MEGESMVFEGSMKKIDPQAKASVESLSQLVTDGYHVLFDSERYNGFIVNKDGKSWRFPETNGLYTYTRREDEANHHWLDDNGLALLWGQKRRVTILKELYGLEEDKPSAYLLDREERLYEMIQQDLIFGNPTDWVEDMIGRVRFGMNQAKQIAFVGGPITVDNMPPRILDKIYNGVNEAYTGGARMFFSHQDIHPRMIAGINYGYPSEFEGMGPEDPKDRLNIPDPFEIMEEAERLAANIPDAQASRVDSINNNLMSTGYSAMQESVEKSKEGFTKRQVERATRARSGYHMAGAPDMKVFK